MLLPAIVFATLCVHLNTGATINANYPDAWDGSDSRAVDAWDGSEEQEFKSDDGLNFIVLGDWGGLPWTPYSTSIERANAKQMGQVANAVKTDFVVALGDNFYWWGVHSIDSSRFFHTWENVYTDESLQIPWYLCAGNHDHYGNVSAQIAYTDKSKNWNFPSLYYSKSWTIPGTSKTVKLIMIDTVTLIASKEADKGLFNHMWLNSMLKKAGFPPVAVHDEAQWAWLENELKVSTDADYLLVGGHFPVWSVAAHGPTYQLVSRLKPLLEKYNVSAYLCGHDHNLQHIKADDSSVHYFVSGAANFIKDNKDHERKVPPGSVKFYWAEEKRLGGFATVRATEDAMYWTYIAGNDGNELYQVKMNPRK